MKVDKKQVEYVAKLARLELEEVEKEAYAQQLSKILDYVETLNKLDTKGVEPTYNITDDKNIFRSKKSDEAEENITLFKNAPQTKKKHLVVPKIIDA